jgi:hypothetical protein
MAQVAVDVHCDGGNNKNVRIKSKFRQHSDADRKHTIMRDGNIVMVFFYQGSSQANSSSNNGIRLTEA